MKLRNGRRFLVTQLAIVTLAALLGITGSFSSSIPAQAAPDRSTKPAVPCGKYDAYVDLGFLLFSTQGLGPCGFAPPEAQTWIQNCTLQTYSVNSDSWLTQQTFQGGSRLAESGRSGIISYAPDCNWYEETSVLGWGQFGTSPLYACGWYYLYETGQSWDYVCTGNIN